MPSGRKGAGENGWSQFHRMIQEQFPHSKVYAIQVRDGKIESYGRVVYTRIFNREDALAQSVAPDLMSDQWRRFAVFCGEMGDAVIAEVHFRDGNPFLVQMEQAGPAGGEKEARTLVAA